VPGTVGAKVPRTAGGWVVLLAVALAGCGKDAAAPSAHPRPTPRARPPFVLVDVSGLRQDDLISREGTPPSAPAFTEAASRLTWFTQAATAAPWESPALATVFTGLIPYDTNMKGRAGIDRPWLIPPIETLAEMLAAEGYATCAVLSGAQVGRPTGLDQGFAAWQEGLAVEAVPDAVDTWLGTRPRDRPFLLYVHLDATRPPPPPGADPAVWGAEAYAASVRTADAAFIRLQAAFTKAALPAETVTFLFSDHGEPRTMPSAPPWRGTDVTDDQVRVPLAVQAAGFPPGRVPASCGLVDLLPTVRDLMGLPPGSGLGGRSLAPLARAPASEGAPIVIQAWRRRTAPAGLVEESLYAVRTGHAKFVAAFTPRPPAWTESVFDLGPDPHEKQGLPAKDLDRFGPEFSRAVERIREVLQGRRSHLQDPIVAGYVAGGG
jgi:arylsulfatase A-like enzyme